MVEVLQLEVRVYEKFERERETFLETFWRVGRVCACVEFKGEVSDIVRADSDADFGLCVVADDICRARGRAVLLGR